MVTLIPFLILSLFATSPNQKKFKTTTTSNSNKNHNHKNKRISFSPSSSSSSSSKNNKKKRENNNNDGKRLGRNRYSRNGNKIRKESKYDNHDNISKVEINPLPPLTTKHSTILPTYFTCRHTYEDTLINEIQRYVINEKLDGQILATSPYAGLIRVDDEMNILPMYYDPIYALQTMPQAIVVSGDSIKNIATSIYEGLLGNGYNEIMNNNNSNSNNVTTENESLHSIKERLRSAPRGSLSIHALVPGMCKGQTKPVMMNRSEKVGEELTKMFQRSYPAARKKAFVNENVNQDDNINEDEKWLLQFMLQSNTIAVASFTQCKVVGPGKDAHWPNWHHPLGLADVNIEEKMPSSAYRKLMEGLDCMRMHPSQHSKVVDLGACPGGWTSVMRRFGSYVTAVDRSSLDQSLMIDDMVQFVKGDAFAFVPEKDENDVNDYDDKWMISDVIAYPERCTELLNSWCSQKLADFMVVTMKFQGNEPDLVELDNAIRIVRGHGYVCRVKHFFNNKNEVTIMVAKGNAKEKKSRLNDGSTLLGKSLYPRILPK